MTKRRRSREFFECPNCGAPVKAGARVCRECGSDDATGWQDSDEIDYQSLDLPDGYRDERQSDALPAGRPRWIGAVALLLVVILVAATLLGLF